ncbi:MAG: ankyrin repeat domain-containing protein [Woeseiaceae bacterium]|nr:ankyrin repeat domain-containing protein [Woeseiaceae bacterium]
MARHRAFLTLLVLVSQYSAAIACEDLYDAAAMGDFDRVVELVDSTEDGASCKAKWGFTPLHGVVTGHGFLTEDDLRIAQYLIDQGADVEARADNGVTPLHICPYPRMIELLVENGASLETEAGNGATAIFFYAEDSNGPDALARALALGANPNHTDNDGRTALDIAISRNESRKVSLLLEFGGSPGDPVTLSKRFEEGVYAIYISRPSEPEEIKVMETENEIGEITLCEDGRDFAFTLSIDGTAWVHLQSLETGMLTRMAEVDAMSGELECTMHEVRMVTANRSYTYHRFLWR